MSIVHGLIERTHFCFFFSFTANNFIRTSWIIGARKLQRNKFSRLDNPYDESKVSLEICAVRTGSEWFGWIGRFEYSQARIAVHAIAVLGAAEVTGDPKRARSCTKHSSNL